MSELQKISAMKYSTFILSTVLLIALGACANADLHDMYVRQMSAHVGHAFNKTTQAQRGTPVSVKTLTNGNMEYQYRHTRFHECIDIYEVDPKTDIVVRYGFIQGPKKDCKWYP
jgi:hypothetical protein